MTALRPLYLLLGWIMLALAAAGTLMPLLPTTPFLLAAAWLFCRSSPAMAAWLQHHPVLGPSLRNWQAERAIAAPTKLVAVTSMAMGYGLTLTLAQLPPLPATLLAAFLLGVASFILTRPRPRPAIPATAAGRPGPACPFPTLGDRVSPQALAE